MLHTLLLSVALSLAAKVPAGASETGSLPLRALLLDQSNSIKVEQMQSLRHSLEAARSTFRRDAALLVQRWATNPTALEETTLDGLIRWVQEHESSARVGSTYSHRALAALRQSVPTDCLNLLIVHHSQPDKPQDFQSELRAILAHGGRVTVLLLGPTTTNENRLLELFRGYVPPGTSPVHYDVAWLTSETAGWGLTRLASPPRCRFIGV